MSSKCEIRKVLTLNHQTTFKFIKGMGMKLLAVSFVSVALCVMLSAANAASPTWGYSEEKNKMTDEITKYAQVESEERSEFGGGPAATLTIEKKLKKSEEIYFIVNTGMANIYCMDHCGNRSCDCKFSVRIDGGTVEQIEFTFRPTLGNAKQVLTVAKPAAILAKLKIAKKLVIEYKTVMAGTFYTTQIAFDVAGLQWS